MKTKSVAIKLSHLHPWIARIGLAFMLCWMTQAPAAAESELVDRIVAIVNEDVISLFDLTLAMKPYQQQLGQLGYTQEKERRMLFKLREDILNQLINDQLTDQQVEKYKIRVSDKAVDSMIENIKKENFYTDEQFRAILAQEGLTAEDFRDRTRERLLRRQLLQREISSKIVVTEEEIKAYYDANREQFAGKADYHLKHILKQVPAGADVAQRQAVLEEMNSIHRRLVAGEPFEALADQFSESGLSEKGGDLGTFPYDSLSAQIQDAVKGLSAGQVTPVLDTDQGLQIFLVYRVDRRPGRSLEDASKEIGEKLYGEVADQHFTQWLEKLRARSHIKIIL